ncbi:hypothetical protein EYF80_029049 [Liparis tanakae]|uniref:Uncharacterized protein n=1 Tax=Liparis tanakae TaxID=230148 RepID=A0A4Z2H643_9TELE|nr:hypothetical protein EYF80_029049 [Liparis tanakae]
MRVAVLLHQDGSHRWPCTYSLDERKLGLALVISLLRRAAAAAGGTHRKHGGQDDEFMADRPAARRTPRRAEWRSATQSPGKMAGETKEPAPPPPRPFPL